MSLLQRLMELQQEAGCLAQGLLEYLGNLSDVSSVEEITKRWEQIEAIVGALEMSQGVLAEEDSEEMKRCARQLRRWRRLEGHNGNVGWIEIRWVNGYGPYVYYRLRKPGERKIHTVYYGRMNQLSHWLAEELQKNTVVSAESRSRTELEVTDFDLRKRRLFQCIREHMTAFQCNAK